MTTVVDAVPARVDGVQLIGEMEGSGYRKPPSLVRRADGQVLQLTPLLYAVLDAVDGSRDYTQIAEIVGEATNRAVTDSDVRTLIDGQLRPLGVLRAADGSEPELKRSDPLLGLKPRVAVTNPDATRRLTDPFRFLFRPVVAVPILFAFFAVVAWVFFQRGLGRSAYDAFERPHLLLLVFVVTVISAGFHEFGHAAAHRYSGGVPGSMGAGFYLVWPAFYTDVTDSYRLGRAGRIRTDLGGLYFNAIVVVVTFVWWWATGWEALLLLVATQVLQMVTQLLPLLRFDGYHVLADLAGVPDLYQRIKPTLRGLLPWKSKDAKQQELTPRARALITLWVLVTVPLMALMLFAMVRALPRLLGSAGSAMGPDAAAFAEAAGEGRFLDVAAHGLAVLTVAVPLLACLLIFGRVAYRSFRGLGRWGRQSAPKGVAAGILALAMVGGLAWAWWPAAETYRPIEPDERGTITALLTGNTSDSAGLDSSGGSAADTRLSGSEPLLATFEDGAALPTQDDPALAMVLVPTDPAGSDGSTAAWDGTWVFPFDQPLPPEAGDNQALAVVTEDGMVSYDVAFAMVWVEDDRALNVNEAHAYASCTDCVAVAVAFQVVLIMDDARVVVPQNLAVAANYDCYSCITAALASQLVLSVEQEPGEQELLALGQVWSELMDFATGITSYTLADITAKLDEIKERITAIVTGAPAIEDVAVATPAPTPVPTPAGDSTTEDEAPGADPSPVPTSPTIQEPEPAPEPVPDGTPAPSPTPEPLP